MAIDVKKQNLLNAELFIAELKKDTNVSDKFLEAARPTIERAFLEVETSNRDICLDAIRESVLTQAETEAHIEGAQIAAERLRDSQSSLFGGLNRLRQEVTKTRDSVGTTTFNMYSNMNKNSNSGVIN